MLASMVAVAGPAHAADAYPCGASFYHPPANQTVQYCPDWSPDNYIPVYATAFPNSMIIGHIYAPGNDWYTCQLQTSGVHNLNGLLNNWWAYTRADNLNWGWVPETYFRGGVNYEADAGLRRC
jgi:hypothetical protein